MPTYAYRCAACDHAFEQYQAFTDDSLTVCPACNEASLRKVFNSIGVTFNGSGFYRTDSRGSGASTDSASTKSTDASGTKSSDASGSSSSSSAPKSAAASTPA